MKGSMMSEKEKMINGKIYDPLNPRLVLERDKASRLCQRYNQKKFHEIRMQNRLMKKLINTSGNFWIKPPFFCDYGYNIYIGENVMLNYGCILLDVCPIRIGAYTLIGPNVQIYTACHSLDPEERMKNIEYGKAVTIGNNVWIGGGAIILPGVTIGDNAVIGAGAVVRKDIPANVVATGNPCRILRNIDDNDRLVKNK